MGREPFCPPGVAPPSCVWPDSFTAPTVLKAARRGPAMRTWSGAARYGRSSGSPRKSLPICALERRHLFGNAVRSGDYAANDLVAKVEVPVSETTLRSLFELDAANFRRGAVDP